MSKKVQQPQILNVTPQIQTNDFHDF